MRKPAGLGVVSSALALAALACGVSDPTAPAAPPAGEHAGGTESAGAGGALGDGGGGASGTAGLGGDGGGGLGAGGSMASGGSNGGGGDPATGGASGAGGTEGSSDGGTGLVGNGGAGGELGTGGAGFDAGTAPDRNRVQAGAVCARLATIQCAGEAACCANPGRSFEECETRMRTGCVNELYLDAISSNSVAGYDGSAAEAAFNRFEELASMCDVSVATWGASANGLRGITPGTRAAGADCTPPNPLNTADAAGYLVACTGGAACLPTLLSGWNCEPRAAAGGNCFTDLNCQDGLYCDNPDLTVSSGHRCEPRKSDGSPCALPNECQSLACRGGTCVPQDQQVAYCLPQ